MVTIVAGATPAKCDGLTPGAANVGCTSSWCRRCGHALFRALIASHAAWPPPALHPAIERRAGLAERSIACSAAQPSASSSKL